MEWLTDVKESWRTRYGHEKSQSSYRDLQLYSHSSILPAFCLWRILLKFQFLRENSVILAWVACLPLGWRRAGHLVTVLTSWHTVGQETQRKGSSCCSRNQGLDVQGDKGSNNDSKGNKNRCAVHQCEQGISLHLFIFSSVFLGVL